MKRFNIILIAALGFFMVACSDSTDVTVSPLSGETDGGSRNMTSVTFAAASDDITVLAFLDEGGDYKYRKTFNGEWVTDDPDGKVYRRHAKLTSGTYKFIFAKGYGENLTLSPATPGRDTDFGDVGFQLASDGTYYLSADELFLEKNPDDVIPYYVPRIATVPSTLSRAVARIDVNLNRGNEENGAFVSVPFDDGHDILDLFRQIELTVDGTGTFVGLLGGQGSGIVRHTLSDADSDEITLDGFAKFTGPYIIPNGAPFDVKVRLVPVDGGEYPVMVKDFTGNSLDRNQRLILNVWVAELQQDTDIIINITAETAPITDLAEGEAGIWD